MEGVKRAEMFENLRKANDAQSMQTKMKILSGLPTGAALAKGLGQLNGTKSRAANQHLAQYTVQPRSNSLSMIGVENPFKPPSLRQLRMETIQRQIIEKTKAGLPVGAQAIDSSNVIMRNNAGSRKSAFDSSKKLGGATFRSGGDAATAQRNLTYDEVKALSDEYMLPCKSIYELHAEFNSLMQMSNGEKRSSEDDEQETQVGEGGIPADYFLKHTNLLKDKYVDIQHAIL